jgi:hypothetical protein
MTAYAAKKNRLLEELAAARARGGASVGLAKRTSNLFRDRPARKRPRVDLSHFNSVLNVDPVAGIVEAEGMTTFVDLADATLAAGTAPRVVPQLKSITLGGAVAGVGIEASSFRFGLVHDTISEIEVLTGDGRALVCTPDNEHRDLFHGMPNSYGTLGYALKLTARTTPASATCTIEHRRYAEPARAFAAIGELARAPGVDFLDGVVFARDALVLTLGRFVDTAPYSSDYTFERIYYQSLRERADDHLTAHDYLWRWDTDWFWCSKNLGLQHHCCAGWWAASVSTRSRIRRSCAGTAAGSSRRRGTACAACIRSRSSRTSIFRSRAPRSSWNSCTPGSASAHLVMSDSGARCAAAVRVVSARIRRHVREFRLLGYGAQPRVSPGRLPQPVDRAQGHRARRPQIALLRFLFHAGRVLGHLQPARV